MPPRMKLTKQRRLGALAVLTVVAIAAIGACSSGSSGKAASEPAAGLASSGASSAGGGSAYGVLAPGAPETRGAAGSIPGPTALGANGASRAQPTTPDTGRPQAYKIRTVTMTVSVKTAADVATQANQADAIAQTYGGEVYGDNRTSGKNATAVLILKVPPKWMSAVLGELSRLGIEKSRTESTSDVTGDVIDVQTRVQNLTAEINTLKALFNPHQKLSDVVALEDQLTSRESDLEALQAQQRALTAETATASITLTLITAHAAAKKKPHHKKAGGFVGGLRSGWHAFVTGATWCAKALGTAVPFAVLLLLVGIGLRLIWPKLGFARRTPAEPAPAGEG